MLCTDTLFAATHKGVFRSVDNGTNWTLANSGLADTIVHSFAVRGTTLFAGTQNGVWKFSSDASTNMARFGLPGSLNTNGSTLTYSNSSGQKTIINYTVGSAQKGTLSVYTSSGRKILSENVNKKGIVILNSSNRLSGVYFARLQAGAELVTKTIVISK